MLDRKEILEKIKADGLYETIADYYYLISKDDLVTILKELDFAIYQYSYKKNIYDKSLPSSTIYYEKSVGSFNYFRPCSNSR